MSKARIVVLTFCQPISLVIVLSLVQACSDPALLPVQPPPQLDQLGTAVREQFEHRWAEVSTLSAKAAGTADELGAAWGALGQWFDVYKFDDSAVKCYRNAHQLAPEQPRWPYYLALQAAARGDYETAKAHYETAAKLAPHMPAPRVRLGDLALRQQQFAVAQTHYQAVLQQQADNPGALLGSARVSHALGDYPAALAALQTVLKQQSDVSEVLYLLGITWGQLGDQKRAASYLQQVPDNNTLQQPLRQDDPWLEELHRLDLSSRSLTRRAYRAFHTGQYLQAALLASQALNVDSDNAELRINYAAVLHKLGRSGAAIEQLEIALRQQPELARGHLVLATVYLDLGKAARAEPILQTALMRDPDLIDARIQLGRAQQLLGRLDEATKTYAEARARAQEHNALASVRFWHAALLLVQGQESMARTALQEDRKLLPEDRLLKLLYARTLATSSRSSAQAVAEARQLVDSDMAAADAFYAETAAMVAAARGDFTAAVSWQRAAVTALDGVRPRHAVHIARRRLTLYERNEPCRMPWEAREALVTTLIAPPTVP